MENCNILPYELFGGNKRFPYCNGIWSQSGNNHKAISDSIKEAAISGNYYIVLRNSTVNDLPSPYCKTLDIGFIEEWTFDQLAGGTHWRNYLGNSKDWNNIFRILKNSLTIRVDQILSSLPCSLLIVCQPV